MVGHGGKIYCSAQCVPRAPRQITVAASSETPLVFAAGATYSTTDAAKDMLRGLSKKKYSVVYLMDKLNRKFGTNYTKDDIVQMRSEL
jgi:hypothetical protein